MKHAEKPAHDCEPVTAAGRISIALVPKAAAGLAQLQERTSLSKTDVVNRAISLYEFIDAQITAGRGLALRDPETGETQTVTFL